MSSANTYTLRPQPAVTTIESPTVVSAGATQMTKPYGSMIAIMPEAVEVDYQAGMEIVDRAARRKLGLTADQFIAKWDAGDYVGDDEDFRAQEVAMLLPLARPTTLDAR
jgi:hypothetical protein